jgi:DNA polymerase-3 subunit delta'
MRWLTSHLDDFSKRLVAAKAHHAPLFLGPAGLGKTQLLHDLAARVLCPNVSDTGPCGQCQSCQLLAAQTHPDKHIVVSEGQSIGVDVIREAIEKLQGRAQLSHHKVLLIPDAQRLTVAAANALLKTLEEPTADTFLLLSATNKHSLLATILSRCEHHYVKRPDAAEIQQWLTREHEVEMSLADIQANQSLPLRCLALAQDDKALTYSQFLQDCQGLADASSVLPMAQKWQANGEDCAHWLQQLAVAHARKLQSETRWRALYQDSVHYRAQLNHPGVNKTLLLHQLLEKYQELLCSL